MAVGVGLARDGGGGAVYDCLGAGERGRGADRLLTRLWSMTSAMTAILPVEGPALRRTTATGERGKRHGECDRPRPTSTKR
jgi:hypothetical protein